MHVTLEYAGVCHVTEGGQSAIALCGSVKKPQKKLKV